MLVSSAEVPLATYKTRQPYKTITVLSAYTHYPIPLRLKRESEKESECEGCRGEDLLI